MKELRFCPKCGHETLSYDGKKMECNDCGFIFYNNTAAAVAVIIKYKDEIMFTKRNQEPGFGGLDLAGGFVDFEETAENACSRELFEELKIKIDESKLKYIAGLPNIYPFQDIVYHTMDLFFEYEVDQKFDVELELKEVSEIKWISKSKLNLQDIAFESQRRFFKMYLDK